MGAPARAAVVRSRGAARTSPAPRGPARSCAGQESPVALPEAVLHSMGAQGHVKTLPAAPPAAVISGLSLAGLPHNQRKVTQKHQPASTMTALLSPGQEAGSPVHSSSAW
ncbi:Transcription Elongation Regulator 1 [Manis pentadactyla]|nr:Transcription Elongation Regulator 1 [Manis pentadactyla]